MKRYTRPAAFLALCALAEPAMPIEKPQYRVVQELQGIEVREYAPYLVAEIEVSGSREEAGNAGFRRLADYIFGKNRGEKKIAMTAPVAQQDGARIAMTAPVAQQERLDCGPSTWVIQFMMPSEYTRDTLPEPLDSGHPVPRGPCEARGRAPVLRHVVGGALPREARRAPGRHGEARVSGRWGNPSGRGMTPRSCPGSCEPTRSWLVSPRDCPEGKGGCPSPSP